MADSGNAASALPGCHRFLGDLSEEDPPVPIPNTEVKLLSPDGTAQATVWESRKSPGLNYKSPPANGGLLHVCASSLRPFVRLATASCFPRLPPVRISVIYSERI